MDVLFLGTETSTGIPYINCNCATCLSDDPRDKRLRSSVIVTVKNKNVLIDCGPDFRQQVLRNKITDISAVLITHEHYDHLNGIDDLRNFGSTPIYAEKRVCDIILRNLPYCFGESKYPGVPQISLNEIENKPFNIDDIPIIPIRVAHSVLPILGFRIERFAYITDVSYIDDAELSKLSDLDVLVVDALRLKSHFSHFSLQEALDFAQSTKAKKVYLTHMSHEMGKQAETEKRLPDNVFFAYDGLKISL